MTLTATEKGWKSGTTNVVSAAATIYIEIFTA